MDAVSFESFTKENFGCSTYITLAYTLVLSVGCWNPKCPPILLSMMSHFSSLLIMEGRKCVKFVLEVIVIWYIWHIYVIPSFTVMINCFVDKWIVSKSVGYTWKFSCSWKLIGIASAWIQFVTSFYYATWLWWVLILKRLCEKITQFDPHYTFSRGLLIIDYVISLVDGMLSWKHSHFFFLSLSNTFHYWKCFESKLRFIIWRNSSEFRIMKWF
jgi:hypothetical protein